MPNARKAALRNNPAWLDALDLSEAPLPRVYPAPRTAIAARRRELELRPRPTVRLPRIEPSEAPTPRPRPWSALASIVLLALLVAACARSAGWL